MQRRSFIKSSAVITTALSLGELSSITLPDEKNSLPFWKGFNLTDFNTPDFDKQRVFTKEEHFNWMKDWGFNFVRLPIAYPYYVKFDRSKNITPAEVYQINQVAVDKIVNLIHLAFKYNLHVSLNLHRAPGYCINAGFIEPYNLWKDQEAQDAFYFHWNMWAKTFKNESKLKISFDLLNEPSMREDMNDQHSKSTAVTGEIYYKVAKNAIEAIRKENKERIVIADGNNVGNTIIPEIKYLNIAQSCRGYFPHAISHYKAPWANKDPDHLPVPVYPGIVGNQMLNRKMIEEYYKPWIDLKNSGVGVHCGECGCWNKTPHDVFIAWFTDVLDILSKNQIGFALWEFIGDFGILNSGRSDIVYENWNGYKLDRKLLDLLQKY